MKQILKVLSLLIAVLFVTVPSYGWTYYDFGTSYFDYHNNTADIDAPGYPGQPDPFDPNPGTTGLGGERFDIENINFAFDATYLYLSLTSSFGTGAYSAVWDYTYAEGDIFFGFNGGMYDYAIDVSAGNLYDVDSWNYIPVVPGGFGSNPFIKGQAGAWSIASGTALGGVDETYSYYAGFESDPLPPGNGNTWIKEYRLQWADLGFGPQDVSTVWFHQTIECGNDIAHERFPVVPEPTTIMLLGMGLLGVGAHLRRKK